MTPKGYTQSSTQSLNSFTCSKDAAHPKPHAAKARGMFQHVCPMQLELCYKKPTSFGSSFCLEPTLQQTEGIAANVHCFS